MSLLRTCWFYFVCLIAGVLTGFVGGYFQVFLHRADHLRLYLSAWAHQIGFFEGFCLILLICVGAAVIGRALVRFAPTAGGSGIQYVEAAWRQEVEPARLRVVFVKFIGGLLTLGSGMALGREGPTVQMGAALGATLGRWLKFTPEELRFLTIASAGTGLGVAFSSPLGGSMFTFEEVTKDIRMNLVIPTLICAFAGCTVSMTILGMQPDYHVISRAFALPNFKEAAAYICFGVFMGAMGPLYNKLVLWLLDANKYFSSLLPEVKAALVGVVVAALVYFAPGLSGGGDLLAQQMLNYSFPIRTILAIGLIRWFFAPLCYSTGVPGGLFSPLLLMGGILGQFFIWILNLFGLNLNPMAFCAVGMSAFFASTICAPITGVLLILEMTACWDLTLPMMIASALAFFTSQALKSMPVYTALRLRIPEVKALEEKGVKVLGPAPIPKDLS